MRGTSGDLVDCILIWQKRKWGRAGTQICCVSFQLLVVGRQSKRRKRKGGVTATPSQLANPLILPPPPVLNSLPFLSGTQTERGMLLCPSSRFPNISRGLLRGQMCACVVSNPPVLLQLLDSDEAVLFHGHPPDYSPHCQSSLTQERPTGSNCTSSSPSAEELPTQKSDCYETLINVTARNA